jgi:hypothetical protein
LLTGSGVRYVIVVGKIVVRDRQLTTIDEVVMPGFRRDFAAIKRRVAKPCPILTGRTGRS